MHNYELSSFVIHVNDYKKSVLVEKVTDVKGTDYRVYGLARSDCIEVTDIYIFFCLNDPTLSVMKSLSVEFNFFVQNNIFRISMGVHV